MPSKRPRSVPALASDCATLAVNTRSAKIALQAKALLARAESLQATYDFEASKLLENEAEALIASLLAADPHTANLSLELAYLRLASDSSQFVPNFQAKAHQVALQAQSLGRNDTLAKVWALSAFSYGRDDNLEAQIARVRQVLEVAAPDNHFAWFVTHLALATSFHWLGAFEYTSRHYRPALIHARAGGDVSLEVICTRHMASAQSIEVRHLWDAGKASPSALAQSETDLLASIAFSQQRFPQRGTHYAHVCLADTYLLQGRHAESLALYEEHIPMLMARGMQRQGYEALSRKSRCLLASGRQDEALVASEQALHGMTTTTEHSMRVTVHRDREVLLRALNRHAEADAQKALSDQAQKEIDALRARYLNSLLHALDPLPSKPAAVAAKSKRR
jgi:tetratricopeptide (TPR) repeat protein